MLITVVIPVYNRAHSVGRAISSVLAQDLPPAYGLAAIVVVDDGSSDDLAGALRPFGERIQCLRHPRNLGAAAARNTGVAAAPEGYVAFLDSDDVWLPGKLSAQIEAMARNGWAASCTAYHLKRGGSPPIVSPRYEDGELDLSDLVWGCFVSPGSTLMFTKTIFERVGPLDTSLGRLEDWDWLVRYAQRNALGFLARPLATIEPSAGGEVATVLQAAERIRAKHAGHLSGEQQRHLLAGLDVACAAAHYGRGEYGAALARLIRSIWRAPVGNAALSAILHNRMAAPSHVASR